MLAKALNHLMAAWPAPPGLGGCTRLQAGIGLGRLCQLPVLFANEYSASIYSLNAMDKVMYRTILFCILLPAFVTELPADIIWNYRSTDDATTVTGQLTTAGNPRDELADGVVFDLKSVDSVILNGELLADWANAEAPPFLALDGSLVTMGSAGQAAINSAEQDFLRAESSGGRNGIVISKPGSDGQTFAGFADGIPNNLFGFDPTTTSFQSTTPVPEPGLISWISLVGLGLVGKRKRRAIRDAS